MNRIEFPDFRPFTVINLMSFLILNALDHVFKGLKTKIAGIFTLEIIARPGEFPLPHPEEFCEGNNNVNVAVTIGLLDSCRKPCKEQNNKF